MNWRDPALRYGLLSVLFSLTACASIEEGKPTQDRAWTTAFTDTRNTTIGRHVNKLLRGKAGSQSGFYPLLRGVDALAARLTLARQAQRSIDTQYYLIKSDTTSHAFLNALLEAADRGVRVRLLIDDVFTSGYDANMRALNTHPNFEVRVFNPFSRAWGGRVWSGISDFQRVNRRMHTKSFTVDNQVSIVGGRNIADEYFGAREDGNFGDLDLATVGPLTRQISTMFDEFWNYQASQALSNKGVSLDEPKQTLKQLREALASNQEQILQSRYASAVENSALSLTTLTETAWEWAPYELFYDTPDKSVKNESAPKKSIVHELQAALQAAEKELILLSPYFVPQSSGVKLFKDMLQRGVSVNIVTNSLAANNHTSVHAGYVSSRKPLLKAGAKLYEVRGDAQVSGVEYKTGDKTSHSTLHTKAFLVDEERLFVGSFNFDPRSAYLNTESGVYIRSVKLGQQFRDFVNTGVKQQAWEVALNDRNKLRWYGSRNDKQEILRKEPQSSWLQRLSVGLMRLFPISGQL